MNVYIIFNFHCDNAASESWNMCCPSTDSRIHKYARNLGTHDTHRWLSRSLSLSVLSTPTLWRDAVDVRRAKQTVAIKTAASLTLIYVALIVSRNTT